jgi:hypothetical protein
MQKKDNLGLWILQQKLEILQAAFTILFMHVNRFCFSLLMQLSVLADNSSSVRLNFNNTICNGSIG